jgi:putative transposon-encoded protein
LITKLKFMYRTIVTPTEKEHSIELPKQFFGKKVEVTVIDVDASAKSKPHPLPQGKKISLTELFQSFGSAPNFPGIEEIRSKAWPSKW